MELDILGADQQEFFAAQGLFEMRKRLAQVLAGTLIVLIGPEQSGKALAAVRAFAFDGQVGQQGAGFIGGEPIQGLAIAFNSESAQ
jgi:hypothetical protein